MAGLQCDIRVLSQNTKLKKKKKDFQDSCSACRDNSLCWWLSCSADDDDVNDDDYDNDD